MNVTHPFWQAPKQFVGQKSFKQTLAPITRTLGFQFQMPWPLPQSAGFYYGQNPVWGRRELVFSGQPEYFAVGNTIPSAGGVPLVNPYTPEMRFSRRNVTTRY